MTNRHLALLPLLLAAACDEPADPPGRGADISIEARDDRDQPIVVASADGATGRVTISTPVFDADLSLPTIALGADDFALEGVKLYPGATIERVRIDASERAGATAVDVDFVAPASASTVRDWFARRLADKGVAINVADDAIAGKTADGDKFVMEFKDAENGTSVGAIHVSG
jgi:hypothetical protein